MALGTPSPALMTKKAASSVSGAVGGWGGSGGGGGGDTGGESTSGFQFPRLPGSPTPEQVQSQQPVVMGPPTRTTPTVQSDSFAPGTWDPIQSLISNQPRVGTGLDPATTNALAMMGIVAPAAQTQSRNHLYTNYNNQIAGNNLALQGVGLSRETLGSQGARYDLDSQGNQIDRDYIGAMRGIADRSLATQMAGIDATEERSLFDIGSKYTTNSWFAPRHRAELDETSGMAERSRQDARQGFDRGEAGYTRDLAKLGLSDQNIDLSRRDLGTAYKRLDLEAARLNLTAKEYYDALQQGIHNLGLSSTFDDIIGTMSSLNPTGIESYLNTLIAASGNQQLLGNSISSATGNPGYGG